MENGKSRVNGRSAEGGRRQFRLRAIFLIMTVSAVALAGLTTGPERRAVSTAILLSLCLPVALAFWAARGRGRVRAFCIAALFPAAGMFLVALFFGATAWKMSSPTGPSDMMRFYAASFLACFLTLTILFGLTAVAVRYVLEKRGGT